MTLDKYDHIYVQWLLFSHQEYISVISSLGQHNRYVVVFHYNRHCYFYCVFLSTAGTIEILLHISLLIIFPLSDYITHIHTLIFIYQFVWMLYLIKTLTLSYNFCKYFYVGLFTFHFLWYLMYINSKCINFTINLAILWFKCGLNFFSLLRHYLTFIHSGFKK